MYANLVSSRLEKFKQVRTGVYTFRCPYCGDSEKYKNKTRGYFFTKKSGLVFKCHNCGVGRSFSNFLKDNAQDVYDEYVLERYKSGLTGKGRNVADPEFSFEKPTFKKKGELKKVSELNKKHPAYEYIVNRKLDPSLFFFTDQFCKWTNEQKPTFKSIKKDQSRIIIPFIDKDGSWFGYQGRSLDPNDKMRYITIMFDEDRSKIYGLDRINESKSVYIVEGPFDSTFIQNSVAMAGSDVDPRTFGWSDYIWVYDNEPRNREIVNRISKTIDRGDNIIIWPKGIEQKDINDMVIAGHDIMSILTMNIYSNLKAKIKFNYWKKI